MVVNVARDVATIPFEFLNRLQSFHSDELRFDEVLVESRQFRHFREVFRASFTSAGEAVSQQVFLPLHLRHPTRAVTVADEKLFFCCNWFSHHQHDFVIESRPPHVRVAAVVEQRDERTQTAADWIRVPVGPVDESMFAHFKHVRVVNPKQFVEELDDKVSFIFRHPQRLKWRMVED